jgi:hypothetical protein
MVPSLLSFAETTIPSNDGMRVLGGESEAPELCLSIPPKNSQEYTTVLGICYVYPDLFSSHPPEAAARPPGERPLLERLTALLGRELDPEKPGRKPPIDG